MRIFRLGMIAVWMAFVPSAANAGDRHAEYYYPTPQSEETYKARARTPEESSRRSSIVFVTGLTNRMLQNPYPPEFAIFAKGAEAAKLIIVAVKGEAYDTLFRMHGVLATLTAVARVAPLFEQGAVRDFFTFFSLCKMLGFKRITVSDGRSFAHRINID